MNNFSKFELKFNDFDQYAELISQADMDHLQMDSGLFIGELSQITYGPIIISTHKMNRLILQNGAGIIGYTTFLIPGNIEQDFLWRKNRLRNCVLGILRSNMEHNCITPINFFAIGVSIEDSFLSEFSVLLGFPNFNKLIQQNESITIDKNKAVQIQQMTQCLFKQEIKDRSGLTYDLPKLIIEAISESSTDHKFIKGKGRTAIFKKAQDIIHTSVKSSII